MSRIIILSVLVLLSASGMAHTPDSSQVFEKLALQNDNLRQGNFAEAKTANDWLITNVPEWNESLYIQGEKIYKGLLRSDPQNKSHQNKLIRILNERMTYFGKKNLVVQRKAYWAYKFWKKEVDKQDEILKLIDSSFLLNGKDVSVALYIAQQDILRRRHLTTNLIIEDWIAEFNEKYQMFRSLYPDNIHHQGIIINMLLEFGRLECSNLGNIQPTKSDSLLLKALVAKGLELKCAHDEVFLEYVNSLSEISPTIGLYKFLATKYERNGDTHQAIKEWNKALLIASDNDKDEIKYELARLSLKQEDLRQAHKILLSVTSTKDNKWFELMGDIYFSSYYRCKEGESRVKGRAVFLLAYDQYEKAENLQKMKSAVAQFPSITEIFEEEFEEGAEIGVPCWGNVVTTIRRRPSL